MATSNVVQITYSDGNGNINKSYHPSFAFNTYRLNWNTGSGYKDSYCINARGNTSFYNSTNGGWAYRDFYVGNGAPDASPLPSETLAGALVGTKIGCVNPFSSRGTTADIATVALGGTFSEWSRSATVNNSSWGSVGGGSLAKGSSSSWMYVKSFPSGSALPDTGYTTSSNISVSTKKGSKCLGIWRNGSKLSSFADSTAEDRGGYVAVFGLPFTVAFNANGGTGSMSSTAYYYGVSDYQPQGNISPCTFSRSGYGFVGWNTDPNGNGVSIVDGASAESVFSATSASAGSTITLYAQWSMNWYAVSYNSHGGSPCASGGGGAGSSVTLPSTTRTGYWFSGWYEHYNENTGEYTSFVGWEWQAYTPTDSITLHAKWQSRLYELGYDNAFLLYEWMLNGYSAQMHPYNTSNGSLGLWQYGQGNIVIYGQADGYADVYTNWERVSLTQKPFYTFPVNSALSTYTVSCDVGFYKDGGFEPTDSPSTNAYGAGVGATRVWLLFYDATGNYIDSGGDPHGGCGTYKGNGVYRIQFDAAIPNNATRAAIFFEAVIRKGERAEFVGIRAMDKVRSSFAPWQTRFVFWYNDSGRATYNEQKDQHSDPLITPSRAGYAFAGWLDDGGNLVTGNSIVQPYSKTIYSTWMALRYLVSCVADVASENAFSSTAAKAGGEPVESVEYGTTVVFSATLKDGYTFDGFYENGVKIADTVTVDGATVSVTRQVTSATTLVAKAKVTVTLRVSSGSHAQMTVDGQVEESHTWTVVLGETISYEIAVDEGYYNNGWYLTSDPEVPDYDYAGTGTYTPTESDDLTLDVQQGTPGKALYYTVGYFAGNNKTMGSISIDGEVVENELTVERTYDASGHVVLVAQPANGYVFDGWYDGNTEEAKLLSGSETLTLLTTTGRRLFAKFEQYTHSICEWEGSDVPKALTWRTKTYAASKPFNPSACRVDGLGYPPSKLVELTVDMFSAPDADARPTASTTLTNIADQDARRLPVRRMERYMQVQIKANVEIDTLLVGTSMEGIAL